MDRSKGIGRRGFLGFLGAAIAGATLDPEKALWIPGKKAFSIPKPPVGCCVRYLYDYDILQHEFVSRLDVLWGSPMPIPLRGATPSFRSVVVSGPDFESCASVVDMLLRETVTKTGLQLPAEAINRLRVPTYEHRMLRLQNSPIIPPPQHTCRIIS